MSSLTENGVIDADDLPPAAFHPTSSRFEDPYDNTTTTDTLPARLSSVEQLLRVVVDAARNKEELKNKAETVIEHQKQYEMENIYSELTINTEPLKQSNDYWLRQTLKTDAIARAQEELDEIEDIFARRTHWYDNDVLSTLLDKYDRAKTILTTPDKREPLFASYTIVDDVDKSGDNLLHANQLDGIPLSTYGIEPPVNLVVHTSPNSGSKYALVPWFGTVCCTDPGKHNNPTQTLCKHEIAAILSMGKTASPQDDLADPPVSSRALQFCAPEATQRAINEVF